MHYVPLLGFVLALLCTASAFVLPAGQADGLYRVSRTASGDEIHEAIDTPPLRRSSLSSSAAEHQLAKRANWGKTYCGCGIKLNHDHAGAAVADLKSQIGHSSYIKPDAAYYSIRGGVVAFVCNADGNAMLKVWPDIVKQGFKEISNACGGFIAGSTGGIHDFAIGYMRHSAGLDFCAEALSSSKGHC